MKRFVLLLALALAAPSGAALPPWAEQVVAGHRAFAHVRTPEGAGAFCKAVDLAPFGAEDPRYAILLYNRAFAAVCCGEIPDHCGTAHEDAEGDLRRAAELVRKHGATGDPEFTVVLWHVGLMDLNRDPMFPGEPGCAGCPQAAEVARLLEAVAPAFAAEPPSQPGTPDLGLRRGAPAAPGSWLADDSPGGHAGIWPRAILHASLEVAPQLARRIFPALALERLARKVMDHGEDELAWDLHRRGVHLREEALGPDHPLAMAGWLDLAATWTKRRPAKAAAQLEAVRPRWQELAGAADHPDMIPLLLRLEAARREAGDHQGAAAARAALAAAAEAPPEEPSSLRRHLTRTPLLLHGYRFGAEAREQARARVAKRGAPPLR